MTLGKIKSTVLKYLCPKMPPGTTMPRVEYVATTREFILHCEWRGHNFAARTGNYELSMFHLCTLVNTVAKAALTSARGE